MDTLGEQTLGVALDPFRPDDVLRAPGTLPPKCPLCQQLIYPVATNDIGDQLFECLNEGYETVYRVAKNAWEPRPRPGLDENGWKPPILSGAPPVMSGLDGGANAQPPVVAPATITPRRVPPAAPRSVDAAPVAPAAQVASTRAGDEDTDWITLADAAAIIGGKPDAVYRRVRRKTLASKRGPDGKILVRGDQLMAPEEPGEGPRAD